MRCECPEITRCCFCLPLRRGLLVAGYGQLASAFFIIACNIFEIYHMANAEYYEIESIISLILYLTTFVFSIVFLYGLHKKLIQPVKVYYYYSIVTCFAIFLLKLVLVIQMMSVRYIFLMYLMFEVQLSVIIALVQIYLLMMIHSFLRKLTTQAGPHQYENTLEKIIYVGGPMNNVHNGDVNGDLNGDVNRDANEESMTRLEV